MTSLSLVEKLDSSMNFGGFFFLEKSTGIEINYIKYQLDVELIWVEFPKGILRPLDGRVRVVSNTLSPS